MASRERQLPSNIQFDSANVNVDQQDFQVAPASSKCLSKRNGLNRLNVSDNPTDFKVKTTAFPERSATEIVSTKGLKKSPTFEHKEDSTNPNIEVEEESHATVKTFSKASISALGIGSLTKYLLYQSFTLSISSCISDINKSAPIGILDFVLIALNRGSVLYCDQKQRKLQREDYDDVKPSGGYKLCNQLKHYKQVSPRRSGAISVQCEPQILHFKDRPFDITHLPAGFPTELCDMKYELNRLKSFHISGKLVCFKTGQQPDILAANGFFYLQEADRVKCAFCLGTLFNWDPDEDVAEAHRLRFATCPMLLGLDVGNVPIQRPDDTKVRLSIQCTESESVPVAATADLTDSSPASVAAIVANNFSAGSAPLREPDMESERQIQLGRRPHPPVSPAAAAVACGRDAASNLEILSQSLRIAAGSGEIGRYHPVLHPAWRDRRCRQEALARLSGSSRPVPADQLADAGFFPLAGQPLGATACHWCGLRILHWAQEDDPWVEHARWSPRCCHLLLERGHVFVLASRASHPPYPLQPLPHAREPLAPIAAGPSAHSAPAALVDYRIEPRFFKARDDYPPALGILQLGCDPEDAKTAQFLQLKTAGDDFQSSELFLESVLTQHRQRHSQGLSGREFYERAQRDQSLVSNREPKPLDDDELDWRACKVCMDSVINVTLLDCNHLCCCSRCAKNLDTCPLCRSPIRAIMLVNMD